MLPRHLFVPVPISPVAETLIELQNDAADSVARFM